jgi:hypothetical protein
MNHQKGRKHEVENFEIQIAYIHGRIEAQIEGFAASLGVSAAELAGRLGELLLGAQGGERLGVDDRLPKLRGKAGAGGQGVESVALAGGTSGERAQQAKSGHLDGVSAGGVKAYWAKMTPAARRKEMRRRLKKRLADDQGQRELKEGRKGAGLE